MFLVNEKDLLKIIESVTGKKVIVYGANDTAIDVIQKLRCIDIDVAYCVEDVFEDISVSLEVRDIYSLLLEKMPFFVIITKENREECAKVLDGLGLKFVYDYNSVFAAGNMYCFADMPLDVNLGFGMRGEAEGVKICGDLKNAKYKIAILGASTTAPVFYPWKSWGEFFWEYNKEEWAVIIGAAPAYNSSQEIIKLLRDIIVLQPDLIISYSGMCDSSFMEGYADRYTRYLYDELKKMKLKNRVGEPKTDYSVCYGVKDDCDNAEKWVNNQKIMHAIAKEFDIEYRAFFHAALYTKFRHEKDEEVYYYCNAYSMKKKMEYTKRVKDILAGQNLDFIEDATMWLDDYDGLFFDHFHLHEEGNRRVAEKVYQSIFGEEKT